MAKGIEHQPSDKTRSQVAALYSFGHTQEDIASYLGICVDTLFKHYEPEMRKARIEANSAVAQKLFNKAVQQDDLSAQIFWLKTRARWRTQDVEAVNEENHRIKQEVERLRRELDEKYKKDY